MGNKYYGLSQQPTSNKEDKIPNWMEEALLSLNNKQEKENPFKNCKNIYMKEYENEN